MSILSLLAKQKTSLTLVLLILLTGLFIIVSYISTPQTIQPRAAEIQQQMLYVSPNGDDTNPGTESSPWKTFYKAAQTAVAGDTVIFEDGTYVESVTTTIKNSGTSEKPIVFKARNSQKAIIIYRGIPDKWKINVTGKPHIQIKDFEITQDNIGTTGSDKFINYFSGANHGIISGNKIHHAYEDLIKIHDSHHVTIENNDLFDIKNEAIDMVNGYNNTIKDNTITDFHRTGIMAKGGARNIKVVSNTITRGNTTSWVQAITLGGSTDAPYVYDPAGYEGYHQIAFNNLIIAKTPGAIAEAMVLAGCKDCAYVHNTVVGADLAIEVMDGPGTSKGWTKEVKSVNPIFQNNIITNCTRSVLSSPEYSGTLTFDYNLIYACPGAPSQPHGSTQNPQFIDPLSDWRLQSSSPAREKALTLQPFSTYSDANTPASDPIDVSDDKAVIKRTEPWDMGAYEMSSPDDSSPTVTSSPTIILATPTSVQPTLLPSSTPIPTNSPTPLSSRDTTPPTITITAPTNGQIVKRRGSITIQASATDDTEVAHVTFKVAGNTSTDFTSPYTYSWNIPGKPNTSYTITATAYDTSNNITSQSIQVKSTK